MNREYNLLYYIYIKLFGNINYALNAAYKSSISAIGYGTSVKCMCIIERAKKIKLFFSLLFTSLTRYYIGPTMTLFRGQQRKCVTLCGEDIIYSLFFFSLYNILKL